MTMIKDQQKNHVHQENPINQGSDNGNSMELMEETSGDSKICSTSMEWSRVRLGELCKNISSGTSNTSSVSGNYPIYGSTGVIGTKDYFDYSGERILVARVGANAGSLYTVSGQYCVSDNTLIISCNDRLDLKFAAYLLESKRLNNFVFGSGQPLITGALLKNIGIPLPPTQEEQQAIATALSDVDALITKLDKLIAKKKAIKQGAMQRLLKSPAQGGQRLPGFEGEWVETTIGEEAKITTGSKNTQDKVESGKYPFFVRSQTVERINTYSFEGEGILTAGDGVGTGKVFHYVNEKMDIHQRVYLISEFKSSIDGYFLFLIFQENFYDRIMSMTAKSSVDSVRREMIADMKIEIPPTIEEQKAIASILSDMDKEIQSLATKKSKYLHIKQGMMQELLTGKTRLPLSEP